MPSHTISIWQYLLKCEWLWNWNWNAYIDIEYTWEKMAAALISASLLTKSRSRGELSWSVTFIICCDVQHTSRAVFLQQMIVHTLFLSVKTGTLYLGFPYLWKFSFMRQILGAVPSMQKCLLVLVWKLWYVHLWVHAYVSQWEVRVCM